MSALMTYLNVAHAFPYNRLSQVTQDVLGFAISEGTIAKKFFENENQDQGHREENQKASDQGSVDGIG